MGHHPAFFKSTFSTSNALDKIGAKLTGAKSFLIHDVSGLSILPEVFPSIAHE